MIANKASLRGAAAPARKRLAQGKLHPWQESGLAKIGKVGEALDRQIIASRPRPDYADPPSEAGFCLWVLGRGPRVKGTRARDIPRTTRACTRIALGATGQATERHEQPQMRVTRSGLAFSPGIAS